jgi:hypothetical protein
MIFPDTDANVGDFPIDSPKEKKKRDGQPISWESKQ